MKKNVYLLGGVFFAVSATILSNMLDCYLCPLMFDTEPCNVAEGTHVTRFITFLAVFYFTNKKRLLKKKK
ncbi:MAG: hypothetical protein WBG43_04615 [Marinifilaceae bacterium]